MLFNSFALLGLLGAIARAETEGVSDVNSFALSNNGGCKCGPSDRCWPAPLIWNVFNLTLGGKLIADTPPAISCYDGPQKNLEKCASLQADLKNSTYIGNSPVAPGFPVNDQCPPVNFAAGEVAGTCTMGGLPRYTVDATNPLQVSAAVVFAHLSNIRLVIRNTGHDILGRSIGDGSLAVWIHNLRQGITFQKTYTASDKCSKSGWKGSAIKIGGGYVWGEVYAIAEANNVIVVGGGDPSVGCIGGYAQGGGHSPANHNYGLAADQILEAQVVLASGLIVTANACQNTDLFTAIRGGGGGTYGVVVSTIVKAHPTTTVSAQVFSMAPLTDANIPDFMDALAILYSAYPDLADAGLNGYGSWAANSYAPVIPNLPYTTGYSHALAIMGKTITDAKNAFASTAAKLSAYNGTSLFMYSEYYTFPTYAQYYRTLSDGLGPVGSEAALGSRLLDRKALTNTTGLKNMLNTVAGNPGQFLQNNFCLVSGGQVFKDAAEPFSGVNPGWRTSYVHNIVAGGWFPGSDAATKAAVHKDITEVKVGSMRAIAPDTGCYMNEADRLDPDYLINFYGGALPKLQAAKKKYDPTGVFYCPTCVGSDAWKEDSQARLCKAN
ncbi:hypothetical protein VF21_06906 [Pseudogymnoascus sp. 05NY08]|nr:hypothetical protein VF21_06906 [Pseudogymnoascus sp. 05NY08]